jgi:circadian clock protein KaiB
MSDSSHQNTYYRLALFISGATTRSLRAVANLHRFCDAELRGQYELEVVDLYQSPERAKAFHVIATPTLLRLDPQPIRCAVGDLSDIATLRSTMKVE